MVEELPRPGEAGRRQTQMVLAGREGACLGRLPSHSHYYCKACLKKRRGQAV